MEENEKLQIEYRPPFLKAYVHDNFASILMYSAYALLGAAVAVWAYRGADAEIAEKTGQAFVSFFEKADIPKLCAIGTALPVVMLAIAVFSGFSMVKTPAAMIFVTFYSAICIFADCILFNAGNLLVCIEYSIKTVIELLSVCISFSQADNFRKNGISSQKSISQTVCAKNVFSYLYGFTVPLAISVLCACVCACAVYFTVKFR